METGVWHVPEFRCLCSALPDAPGGHCFAVVAGARHLSFCQSFARCSVGLSAFPSKFRAEILPLGGLEHWDVRLVPKLILEADFDGGTALSGGLAGEAVGFGFAADPGFLRHAGEEGADHAIPKFEDGLVGFLLGNSMVRHLGCFHCLDACLWAV